MLWEIYIKTEEVQMEDMTLSQLFWDMVIGKW